MTPQLPEDKRLRYHPLNKRQLAFVRSYNSDLEDSLAQDGFENTLKKITLADVVAEIRLASR